MEWTTERRYRRYEDRTKEEKLAIQDHMVKSPGIHTTSLSQKLVS